MSAEEALDHVAGYCVCNDVSERHFQTQLSGQWTKGKSCDMFGPTGPWLVTKDEIADVQALDMAKSKKVECRPATGCGLWRMVVNTTTYHDCVKSRLVLGNTSQEGVCGSIVVVRKLLLPTRPLTSSATTNQGTTVVSSG